MQVMLLKTYFTGHKHKVDFFWIRICLLFHCIQKFAHSTLISDSFDKIFVWFSITLTVYHKENVTVNGSILSSQKNSIKLALTCIFRNLSESLFHNFFFFFFCGKFHTIQILNVLILKYSVTLGMSTITSISNSNFVDK